MLNLPQLSGFIATGLMLWSGAHLALFESQARSIPDPTLPQAEEPVVSYRVDLEEIHAFEQYYTNDLNPFVPWSKRDREKRRWRNKRRPSNNKPPTQVPEKMKPPPPPEKPTTLPPLKLPAFSGVTASVPKVIGSIATDEQFLLFVQLGKEEKPLRAGEQIGGWTLLGLVNQVARFQDPDGEILEVPVGNTENDGNSIADKNGGNTSNTGQTGAQIPQLSNGLQAKDVLELLKDPDNEQRVQEMMKQPEFRRMLSNPSIQKYLRDNGLGHLVDGRR